MKNRNDEVDSIHLRAIKYAAKRPTGFSYKEIEFHYSKRKDEWEVVKEFLHEASNNKFMGRNLVTPFVLLKKPGTDVTNFIFTLSYEAFFNYVDYLELIEARKNSRQAFWLSFIAIVIAVISIFLN